MPFGEQFECLSAILKNRRLRRLCIDQIGLGMHLSEQRVKAFGSQGEPITMAAPMKIT